MSQFENRYLCCRLDHEVYAAPLLEVKKVLAIPNITPLPQAPNYFLGIMNLRGQVISVIDLRVKFGLNAQQHAETCIVIFEYTDLSIGVVVDEVKSVLSLKQGEMCDPPEGKQAKAVEFITGIINREGQMILSVDIARALDLKKDMVQKLISQKVA